MTDIVKFAGAGLPSAKSLSSALRSMNAGTDTSGGMVILKMDKTGHWVFGKDQDEVEEGSRWAVNPMSFVHGYIAWGEGVVLSEKMAPVSEPLPETGPVPAGAARGWEVQVGVNLRCVSGEDEGMEARYTVTSVGGRKAVTALGNLIADQVDKDEKHIVPVVLLKKEHYQHKSYGRIYTPVFELLKWVALTGDATPPVEEAPEAAVSDEGVQPRRRRRSA
jgi:hypothetical protein